MNVKKRLFLALLVFSACVILSLLQLPYLKQGTAPHFQNVQKKSVNASFNDWWDFYERLLVKYEGKEMSIDEKMVALQAAFTHHLHHDHDNVKSSLLADIIAVSLNSRLFSKRLCKTYSAAALSLYSKELYDKRVFVSLNLHQNEKNLPDFIYQLMRLLSVFKKANIFVSIYENGSMDDTRLYLTLLRLNLQALNIPHSIFTQDVAKPHGIHRIEYLAKLRNQAMKPLFHSTALYDKIVFLNDIFFCAEDVLELVWQSVLNRADLVCGVDYDWPRKDSRGPGFYDTWVSKDVSGLPFVKWPWDDFVPHENSRDRLHALKPFQVSCCWNGAAVLNPVPFLNGLRFRRSRDDECSASECSLMCKDLALRGHDRFLVVPSAKFAYEDDIWNEILERRWKNPTFRSRTNLSIEAVAKWEDYPRRVKCQGLVGYGRSPDQPWIWEK